MFTSFIFDMEMRSEIRIKCEAISDGPPISILPNVAGEKSIHEAFDEEMVKNEKPQSPHTNEALPVPEKAPTLRAVDTIQWISDISDVLPFVEEKSGKEYLKFATLVLPVLQLNTAQIFESTEREVTSSKSHLQSMIELSDAARARQLAEARKAVEEEWRPWYDEFQTTIAALVAMLRDSCKRINAIHCSKNEACECLNAEAKALQNLCSGLNLGSHKELWTKRIEEVVSSELESALARANKNATAMANDARGDLKRISLSSVKQMPLVKNSEPLVDRVAAAERRAALVRAIHEITSAIRQCEEQL